MSLPVKSISSGITNNVQIYQGTSLELSLLQKDPNLGTAVDLTSSTFVLTVKARDAISGQATGSALFTVAGVNASQTGATLGVVTFTLTPAETAALAVGVYTFDIQWTDASSYKIESVPLSRFEVLPTVTP